MNVSSPLISNYLSLIRFVSKLLSGFLWNDISRKSWLTKLVSFGAFAVSSAKISKNSG